MCNICVGSVQGDAVATEARWGGPAVCHHASTAARIDSMADGDDASNVDCESDRLKYTPDLSVGARGRVGLARSSFYRPLCRVCAEGKHWTRRSGG